MIMLEAVVRVADMLADYARRVVGEGCEETLRADSHALGVQRGPNSVLRP